MISFSKYTFRINPFFYGKAFCILVTLSKIVFQMGMGSETGDKAETEYRGNLDPQKSFKVFLPHQYLSF